MKKLYILAALCALFCVGCVQTKVEKMEGHLGSVDRQSFPEIKGAQLELAISGSPELVAGRDEKVTFILRNLSKSPLNIPEWFSHEPDNIEISCQVWFPKQTAPVEDRWLTYPVIPKRPVMRYPLRIGGHILCGTGQPQTRFAGTREPGSDQFVLENDKMTAEVIADSLGGHVRPWYLKLIYKCKGADKIALVSDCCAGGDTMGSDVNIINGDLYGSRLTLSVAIKNMRKHTGASVEEVIKMVTSTPAKAIGLYSERGSIESGKIADLVVLDNDLNVKGVFLEGNIVRQDF